MKKNKEIYQSASKLVFILLTITACAGFLMGILEATDFMILAIAAFSYYFGAKGKNSTSK